MLAGCAAIALHFLDDNGAERFVVCLDDIDHILIQLLDGFQKTEHHIGQITDQGVAESGRVGLELHHRFGHGLGGLVFCQLAGFGLVDGVFQFFEIFHTQRRKINIIIVHHLLAALYRFFIQRANADLGLQHVIGLDNLGFFRLCHFDSHVSGDP